ncbi:MAG: AAA family ATPase, partial [Pseudomonadota bacterium]
VSKHYGESEAALRNIFAAASKDTPAIIFIDEIDAIAPRRDSLSGEKQVERRVVAQLLTLMDGLAERGRVIIMAATNLPDSLDPALRRPGRFDREIRFGPPKAPARKEILEIHLRDAPLSDDVDLGHIATQAHGYVGADLAALAREASLAALDRTVTDAGGEQAVRPEDLVITQRDMQHGLNVTSPSALRDTLIESPTLTFNDIGGMQSTKDALREAVIWPFQHRDTFDAFNLRSVSGVLMSGPPGSGKTMLARALASESGMNFIPIRPARIMSQFMGEAERAIAEVFAKARQSAPCLIFFDELDALAPRRNGKDATIDRIVAQLLTDMDGMARNTDVVVLAATNRVSAIDPALVRPGRFDVVIRIPLPDPSARHAILDVHTNALPMADDVDLKRIADQTNCMSGADLAALAMAAARTAAHRHLRHPGGPAHLIMQDFEQALEQARQSIDIRTDDFISRQELT